MQYVPDHGMFNTEFIRLVRRLALLCAAGLLFATAPRTAAARAVVLTQGPVVGAVTATTARVFVRTSAGAPVRVRYGKKPDLSDAVKSVTQRTTAGHDFTTILPLRQLTPATVYYLDILVNGVSQFARPYPQFRTFPAPGTAASFRFVVLTDFGENGSSQLPLTTQVPTFHNAAAENPAFVIIGGDFGHNNMQTLQAKRRQFRNLYSLNSPSGPYDSFVKNILRQFPVAHMWDDHDFGKNNADKRYPFKKRSLSVLQEYFPVYPVSQYGDWQTFSYGQADFFLLDSRSQRDPDDEPDLANKSMLDGDNLGAAGQLEWLKNGLLHSTAQWKFIVTPVVFNPTDFKPDSWFGFQNERNALIKFIQDNSISGVILLSGDSHIGGIDNGTNSGFPEMVSPGPNLANCATTANPGKWSQGVYWTSTLGPPCNGYGVVAVRADPPQIMLQVKDTKGKSKLSLVVTPARVTPPTTTPTPTPTFTATPTATETVIPSTATPTVTATASATATATATPTFTPTATPTLTPTMTATETVTIPTDTPTLTPTETPTDVPTELPTETATETPTDDGVSSRTMPILHTRREDTSGQGS